MRRNLKIFCVLPPLYTGFVYKIYYCFTDYLYRYNNKIKTKLEIKEISCDYITIKI